MMVPSEEDELYDSDDTMEQLQENIETTVQVPAAQPEAAQITLHALSGQNANNTLRVKGTVKNRS